MKIVAYFDILGMPAVPWSAPDIGVAKNGGRHRFAKKDPRLAEWQAYVRAEAAKITSKVGLRLGPLAITLTFYRKTPPGFRHGQLWSGEVAWNDEKGEYVKLGKPLPDLVNLFKGTEDALQGVFFGNDVQTCQIVSTRLYGPLDGVAVEIYEIEPWDYSGYGEPVGGGRDDSGPQEGRTAAPVRVRKRPDRPAVPRAGRKRKPGREDQVGVAVPLSVRPGVPVHAAAP